MSVKLLLSQPAGGKTSFCIDEICKVRSMDPIAPVKIIVPDRMQAAYWKRKLSHTAGSIGRRSGFIGTDIISFSKLALELLNGCGESPVLIPARLDSMCVREAVRLASENSSLDYFEPIMEKPGVISVFEKALRTLRQECISPEMLGSVSGGDMKTADTVKVYCAYLNILKKNNWTGTAGFLNVAAEALEKGCTTFLHCPLIVVDGFDRLTNESLHLLRVLSACSEKMLITLPARAGSDDPSDLRIIAEAERIRKALDAEYIGMTRKEGVSDLLKLADRVFYPGTSELSGKDTKCVVSRSSLLMIEASSRSAEVREALREMKRCILKGQLAHSDCAVFVPDMASYAPVLRQFGREMGIPLRFSQKQLLSRSPAASALKRLLRLAPDFETVQLLSVLRLPFLSGCPDPEDGEYGSYSSDLFVLDQIGRKMNVISGTAEWESAFAQAALSAPEKVAEITDENEEAEEGKIYEYPPREKLSRIRDSFLKFADLVTPPDGVHSRAEWIKWLETLLETIRFYEQIEDRKGRSFEADFKALLRRIVFCEEELKQGPVSFEAFLSEIESEMDKSEQTEPEFAADRIFVGDISQTSGCRWKLIVLTGFAEGIFPRAEHEELILTRVIRERLGLPAGPDQQLMFRHALTRSDGTVIITRPVKTDKGEEWPESIFWQNIRRMVDGRENILTVTENIPVTSGSLNEFAFRIARSGSKEIPNSVSEPEAEKLREKLSAAEKEFEKARFQSAGQYSMSPDQALIDALADPVRDSMPFSCSAIETWLTCPFRYFLSRKLHLEQLQQPGTGMDAAQIGTLNHLVMEMTFPPGTIYDSMDDVLEKANKNIDRVFATAPQDFGFRESELWEYEKEKYREKLLESIEKMFSSSRGRMPMNNRWKCIGAEMKFGYPKEGQDNTDPLLIETEAGPIRIRGIIDRVDQRDDGLIRVVDYKTGSSGFGKDELAAGSHIQAGVYAAAAVHALKLGTKSEGMYWSINDKSVKHPIEYDSEKDESVPNLSFLNKFAAGIRDADFPAEPAGGSCPDYCPAAAWCRRYSRRKKYV